ncbi:InlB B-repeat-containing protein [Lachnospiraceae bacterium LCP25S3_G4]
MKKSWKTGLLSLFFFLSIIGVAIVVPHQEVRAGNFDNAVDFYNNYGSGIVFKDGYFYYATRGKAATANVSTTHWSTIGYRMRVNTSSQSTYIYFNLSGYTVETVNEVYSDGYIYDLCRINLSYVKSKLAQTNRTAYNEFIINGGYLIVDSCMITVKIDRYGNRTNSGSMDDYGNFWGSVYTDYNGIANAAPWSNPSSLHSYFNKTINYVTELKSRQVVYVRYQNVDGDYGGYSVVINKDYVYGETVSWSRSADTCYNAASISYTAKQDKTSYVSVSRKQYLQNVYVKYQDANGNYSSDWGLAKSQNLYYGSNFEWSYGGNDCYNASSISKYTVTEAKNHYIYISRKKYTVSVSAGTGIESVSGGGSYYYGATSTVDAAVKTGYTWKNWSGTYTSISKRYSFTVIGNVALTANAEANTYYIVFYPNGGSGTMTTMTCKYDQTYTLPEMSFTPPAHPCTYLGWNTDANAYSASYSEKQQIRNLTSIDGYTFYFYAIWDYAPDLTCSDRYFTLYEAKTGIITEAELLRTVKSTDREDETTQIMVKNYSLTMFTSFTSSEELVITYTTTDSRNNTTEKQVKVTIVDTDATVEGPMDFDGKKQYARFIDSSYYLKSYEAGGLESSSKWRSEVTYKDTLEAAMNNVKGEDGNWSHTVQTWEFSKEDIVQVKQYVKDNGMGNSVDIRNLLRFLNLFIRCRDSSM